MPNVPRHGRHPPQRGARIFGNDNAGGGVEDVADEEGSDDEPEPEHGALGVELLRDEAVRDDVDDGEDSGEDVERPPEPVECVARHVSVLRLCQVKTQTAGFRLVNAKERERVPDYHGLAESNESTSTSRGEKGNCIG